MKKSKLPFMMCLGLMFGGVGSGVVYADTLVTDHQDFQKLYALKNVTEINSVKQVMNVRNVVGYGATPDYVNGTDDDTAAIQAAIDVGPGIVFFPPGRYDLRAQSGLKINVPEASITLRGAPLIASKLVYYGTSTALRIETDNSPNSMQAHCLLDGMNIQGDIDGSGNRVANHILYLDRVNRVHCVNSTFGESADACVKMDWSVYNEFYRCRIGGGKYGIRVPNVGPSTTIRIYGGEISDNREHGIYASSTLQMLVNGVTFEKNGRSGAGSAVKLDDNCRSVKLDSCWFEQSYGAYDVELIDGAAATTIENCYFSSEISTHGGTANSIYQSDADYTKLLGNTFVNNKEHFKRVSGNYAVAVNNLVMAGDLGDDDDFAMKQSFSTLSASHIKAGNYIINGLHVNSPGVSGWGAAEKGIMWFNTTSNRIQYWDGSQVRNVENTP